VPDSLRSIDNQLLLFFNGLHNSALDFVMYWASNRWVWLPLYAYLFWVLRKNYPKGFLALLLIVAMMITVSDQLSSSVIKNAVMRLRPCHNAALASQLHLVNGYCGGQYGFVSSHASNSFALLSFLFFLLKNKFYGLKIWLLIWAVVVSYSRIYLGAHYPSDVFCGALLGVIVGFAAEYCFRLFIYPVERVAEEEPTDKPLI